MNDKIRILKQFFGHDQFRAGQEQVVGALLAGRDALCVMPTGAGKSVCYQVPALLSAGITLVVSPLISLMNDQVTALTQNGIPAAYINSSLTPGQYQRALQNLLAGQYKLVYVAPERLLNGDFIQICRQVPVSLLAVDEAHCISQWGQDFRPSYLRIPEFILSLGYRPTIGAFTATATERVRQDIGQALGLWDPFSITTGFDRPNLRFSVVRKAVKPRALLGILKRQGDASGIVYCATRKTVEEVCDLLCREGYSATRYHAGLTDLERRQNQEDFVFDRKAIMVATNAFGMGIDKSNVGFVVHYNMPMDLESYYQEAGRAGRDGSAAQCVLLYNPGDVHTNRFLIEEGEPNPALTPQEQAALREKDHERLKQMTFYATTSRCLRSFLLGYFGEMVPERCENCSNCHQEAWEEALTQKAPPAEKPARGRRTRKAAAQAPAPEAATAVRLSTPAAEQSDPELLQALKVLRRQLADQQRVPAFVVFSDTSLEDMCRKRPQNEAEFLAVSGVGAKKLEQYGSSFLEVLRRFP